VQTCDKSSILCHLPTATNTTALSRFPRRPQMARHLSASNSQSQRRSKVAVMREKLLQQVTLVSLNPLPPGICIYFHGTLPPPRVFSVLLGHDPSCCDETAHRPWSTLLSPSDGTRNISWCSTAEYPVRNGATTAHRTGSTGLRRCGPENKFAPQKAHHDSALPRFHAFLCIPLFPVWPSSQPKNAPRAQRYVCRVRRTVLHAALHPSFFATRLKARTCLHDSSSSSQAHSARTILLLSRALALALAIATSWGHPRMLRTTLSAATVVRLSAAKGAHFYSEYSPC
jgi:hypothetical protein